MKAYEVNFDGIVGLSHNFAGLSYGNVASEKHAGAMSKPRKAALQGLKKMKALHDLGLKQGVLPPQERPNIHVLRRLGFNGNDEAILAEVSQKHINLLYNVSSASSMWTANACTTSPSADTHDGRVHFTPANLANKFHRSIEWPTTARVLKATFSDESFFAHHPALPSTSHFGDEGAANFTRFCHRYEDPGVELFVFGRSIFNGHKPKPKKFPARQTKESCEMLARLHGLHPEKTVIAQQNPQAIDAGVFHNDVIAVGNQHVFLFHEFAFLNNDKTITEIEKKFGDGFLPIEVKNDAVPIKDAVKSYLFNSQLITLPDGNMIVVAPNNARKNERVSTYLESLVADSSNPIKDVVYFKLKESMNNGGGPACLRQRVVLTEDELGAINQHCLLSDSKYQQLQDWVMKHYPETLALDDLQDPGFLLRSRTALDELTQLLQLGSIYQFQIN